ncbi:MAG: ABC transporter permease subunit [Gammaproteobacteria bacterium]|nr:ABC transporter permease subunit [Gammaproteobacteria bacterium]
MSRLLAALKLELFLARYSLAARIAVLAPALVCLARFPLVWLSQAGGQARAGLVGAGDFELAQAQNAYGHFVDGVNTGITILALLLVALAAHDFSGERDNGSLRHVLIRRAGRGSIVLAKLLKLHILGLLALVLLGLAAWGGSALLWDFGPVVEDGFELIGEDEILREIHLGLLMAVIPLPAVIAFGLLVSVAAQSATQAVTAALGATLAMDIFKSLLGERAWYLYATFHPSLLDQSYLREVSRLVRGFSDVLVMDRFFVFNTWAPAVSALALALAALLLARRRSL